MEIVPVSYYSPEVCNDEGECFLDDSTGALVMSYQSSKSPSAILESSEKLSNEILYGEKVNKRFPVSCKIDNVVKPYCNQDQNSNGIDDAEELFHYFANPEMEDADEDGFSNAEEITAGTKAFHPFDFPGVPTADTIQGMTELAELIEMKLSTKRGNKLVSKSFWDAAEVGYSANIAGQNLVNKAKLLPNSQVEDIIRSGRLSSPVGNGVSNACKETSVCIVSDLSDEETAIEAGKIEGCLNLMRRAVGEVSGDECRYCKTKVEIANFENDVCNDSNLLVFFPQTQGRSHAMLNAGAVVIFPSDMREDAYTECHELGHSFYGANDRYTRQDVHNPLVNIPSLYSVHPQGGCLTAYDMFNLQLTAIARNTGGSVSEILASTVTCVTDTRKYGIQINYHGIKSKCVENWQQYTNQNDIQLFCPPYGNKKLEFPKEKVPFESTCYCHEIGKGSDKHCCEHKNDIICGDDCCAGKCINGVCSKESVCPSGETEYQDDDGNIKCCSNDRIVRDNGKVTCCGNDEIQCGGVCCHVMSCLHTPEGDMCCGEDTPYACYGGNQSGCCKYACKHEDIGSSEFSCLTCPIARACQGPYGMITCCKEGEFCNNGICTSCPEGLPIPDKGLGAGMCLCKEGEGSFLPCPNGDSSVCCKEGEGCVAGKGCYKCPEGSVTIDPIFTGNNLGAPKCMCSLGSEACLTADGLVCCGKDERCDPDTKACVPCPKDMVGSGALCLCSDARPSCDGECCSENQQCSSNVVGLTNPSSKCLECPKDSVLFQGRCTCKETDRAANYDGSKLICCKKNEWFDMATSKCKACPRNTHVDMSGSQCLCDSTQTPVFYDQYSRPYCCNKNQKAVVNPSPSSPFQLIFVRCENCPKGASSDSSGLSCACGNGMPLCDGKECCEINQVCKDNKCQDCPAGSQRNETDNCVCGDGRLLCGNECCGERQLCDYHNCKDCPEGTKAVIGEFHQWECLCEDGRKPCGDVGCCRKDQECRYGECQDCPEGAETKGSDYCKCGDGRLPCGDECCGGKQICNYHNCKDCPEGAKAVVGEFHQWECLCEDGRKPCGKKCCGSEEECAGIECVSAPTPNETLSLDPVSPINGSCPSGYTFFNNIHDFCCPKCLAIGAGIDTQTGEYKCFKSYDPNIEECLANIS